MKVFAEFATVVALAVSQAAIAQGSHVSPGSSSQPTIVPITGESVNLTLSLDSNECLPTGPLLQKFNAGREAMDHDHEIIEILYCRNGAPVSPKDNYTLLQADLSASLRYMPRTLALDNLDLQIKSLMRDMDQKKMDSQVNNNLNKNVHVNPGIETQFGYIGRDDDCIYYGGQMGFDPKSRTSPGMVVSCVSVVDGRGVSISRYNFLKGAAIERMKNEARSILLSIHGS